MQCGGEYGGRGRRWGLLGCGVALTAPAALLVVRLAGLDAGTPLAMPMVLFPWTTVIGVLVLLLIAAVPVLRSRWALVGVTVLLIAHAALLAPRFLPDGRQVAGARGRAACGHDQHQRGAADAQAVVELVRTERIDVLAVQQMPPGGVEALDRAGLDTLLPYQELRPEYDSSIYSRLPLTDSRHDAR